MRTPPSWATWLNITPAPASSTEAPETRPRKTRENDESQLTRPFGWRFHHWISKDKTQEFSNQILIRKSLVCLAHAQFNVSSFWRWMKAHQSLRVNIYIYIIFLDWKWERDGWCAFIRRQNKETLNWTWARQTSNFRIRIWFEKSWVSPFEI